MEKPQKLSWEWSHTHSAGKEPRLVEKAVEIGVDRITPVICDHSERPSLKTERLERIALSAMKQSLKSRSPQIDTPVRLVEFLKQRGTGEMCQRFVCYCDGDERRTLPDSYSPGTDAVVLIGPEGDFSPREIESALAAGFIPITLGDSRLRTETAALAAVAAVYFHYCGDKGM